MEKLECPRKIERRVGLLESFKTNPGDCFASVRIDGQLFKLPLSARGNLQEDQKTITHCVNGERYYPIALATQIAVDMVYDVNNQNPITGLWAPKPNQGRCK
jgi:hypothetical protein